MTTWDGTDDPGGGWSEVTARLLTAAQVADLLGVSAETVLRWHRRGELPAFRLPSGAIRFGEAALDLWMLERATPGRGSVTHPGERRPRTTLQASPTPEDDEE